MDGNVIDVRTGRDDCVVVYVEGDPNSTLDRTEPVCRCKSAIVSRLNEYLVVADSESMKMVCPWWYLSIFKKLSAPKIDAMSRARTDLARKRKGVTGCPCFALGVLGIEIGDLRPKCPNQRSSQIRIIWGITFTHLPSAHPPQLPPLLDFRDQSQDIVPDQEDFHIPFEE